MTKTVLVIGGASGIGLAVSQGFAQSGHHVCIADIDADRLAEVGRTLGCQTAVVDVRQGQQLERAVAQAAVGGVLDVAVNCAGIEGTVDLLVHQDDDALERVLAVNALGMLLALKYELRQMVRQGHGSICNVASMLGLRGQPRWSGYCASKHAVIGATRAAALEVAQQGIRVNAVAPGLIATPLLARANGGHPARGAAYVPVRALGEPDDVAAAVAWLCADASRYVTGTVLSCDGGATAQVATTPDFSRSDFRV